MRILVTGATGRIGARLIPRLLRGGDMVRILVRDVQRADTLQSLGAEVAVGDLTNPVSLRDAVCGIDAIIHLAAFFRGANPAEVQRVNQDGTLALATLAINTEIKRFVFLSTNLVYGPTNGTVLTEETPPHPATPYPMSKSAAEESLMELYRVRGLDLRILRLAFVYGEGDPHLREGLSWFRQWNPNQPIHLLHHADVAQAIMLVVGKDGLHGQIYNVADDEPVKVGDVLRVYDEDPVEEAFSRPLNREWLQIMDTHKIHTLGFRPRFPSIQNAVLEDTL